MSVKSKVLFTSILLVFCFSKRIYAQNFEAYLIAGFDVSQIDGDKLSGYNKGGAVIGGATGFKLNDQWSLLQEITYYQRGSRATNKQLSLDNFSVRRIDYIDLSLIGNHLFNEQWSLLLGAGYGIFVNVKSDVKEDKSLYNGDLFLTIGPQYALSAVLSVAIKLQYSTLPIFENQDAYNNSISLTLRYKMISK